MEQHKHFGSIMMTFFAVYTIVVLFTVLSAISVNAVEYLDEFPPEPEFLQLARTKVIDTCKDGTTVTTFVYDVLREPGLIYVEVYLSSNTETPISVLFVELFGDDADDNTLDIYIRDLNRIAWYQSYFEFKKAYPKGICPRGTDL